jgi:hypothetical protein
VRSSAWPAQKSCPARCIALLARTRNRQFFANSYAIYRISETIRVLLFMTLAIL